MIDRLIAILKGSWVAFLAFLAFYAASVAHREKKFKKNWQDEASQRAAEARSESIYEAESALDEADKHRKRARWARHKTQKRLDAIARKNDEMADILDRWNADVVREQSGPEPMG